MFIGINSRILDRFDEIKIAVIIESLFVVWTSIKFKYYIAWGLLGTFNEYYLCY